MWLRFDFRLLVTNALASLALSAALLIPATQELPMALASIFAYLLPMALVLGTIFGLAIQLILNFPRPLRYGKSAVKAWLPGVSAALITHAICWVDSHP